MADIYRSDIVPVDLNHALSRKHVGSVLATGDNGSNRFGASVLRDGKAVDLTGCGVTAYFMRPGQNALTLKGQTDGHVAYVDLEQACYTLPSSFTLTIKVSGNGITSALRIIDGYILLTQTDELDAPTGTVPTLDDIFAQIAAIEAATASANEATNLALAAKDNANGAAVNAVNIATTKGNEAIQLAQQEADKQNAAIAALTQDIARDTAPAIIPTATGKVVTVFDSAHRPLAGLRLYGKTTQDGTPTPNSPVPLVNVGAGGSIGVKASGKNLFAGRGTTAANSGVTLLGGCGSIITLYGTATATTGIPATEVKLPAGSYVLSLGDIGNVERFEPTIDGVAQTQMHSNGTYPFVLTKPSVIGLNAIIYSGSTLGTEASPTRVLAQLEVGTIATAYEQHKEPQAVTASTVGGLPGIPVTSGGNYTDENGQMWLCDEKDYERGEYVENMLTITLNGSNYPFTAYNIGFSAALPLGYDAAYGDYRAISSHLTFDGYMTNTNSMGRDDAFAIYRHPDPVVGVCSIFIRMTRFATADELNAWLAINPVTIMYPRRKPIVTPLSASELAAFRAMTSQYPHTTVYNDAGAGLAVDYIADTKNYIDQRISALLNA